MNARKSETLTNLVGISLLTASFAIPGASFSADTPKAATNLTLAARCLDANGKTVDASLYFWKLDPDAVKDDTGAGWWTSSFDAQVWYDRANGKSWRLFHSFGGSKLAKVDDLEPGEYRVTAAAGNALTPIGVSPVIRLTPSKRETECEVRLETGPCLTVSATNWDTGELVDRFQVVLLREDGLPVVYWSNSPWAVWSREKGAVVYESLAMGDYEIRARCRAFQFGESEMTAAEEPLKIRVLAGQDQRVVIGLKPVPLKDEEVRQRWPFAVTGRVTDRSGKALSGVTVASHCGMGTLMPTGKAMTDADGRYTLRFGPGMHVKRGTQWGVGVQAATIHPSKPGYTEANLHRQGDLLMADQLPGPNDDVGWKVDTNKVVVPDKPFHLDFVMVPAGSLEGRLLDGQGRPLPGKKVYLTGPELPPSSSVLGGAETDKDGSFQFADVPLDRRWQLYLSDASETKSELFTLGSTAPRKVVLKVSSDAGKRSLHVRPQSE